jgi:hypothetical protein
MSSCKPAKILFVVGMHRSGTSALCAALAACGASFGEQLIDAMAGVNDEGFWEDAGVVAVNEQLLTLADSSWYAPADGLADINWDSERFAPQRTQASALLCAGFGDRPVQAVKDPRLCLTLPFWLEVCAELGIAARVYVINRAPLEVARSLDKRDGFPLGYGLRLYAAYWACIQRFVPADTTYLHYDDLLRDANAVMSRLAEELPGLVVSPSVTAAVRMDLRHQRAGAENTPLSGADSGEVDLATLNREIELSYPMNQTLRELADKLTARGQELAQIGEEHAAALTTLDERDRDVEALSAEHLKALVTVDERDADIESLAAEHRSALATIEERDEQIREFDRRLSQLGDEHSHALQVLRERDAELAWIKQRLDAVSKVPGVGYLIRRLRKHAQG